MSAPFATARTTGALYLGLAVTGALGHLVLRGRLFSADDPAATLAHLVEQPGTARAALALELGIVLTQALTAVWFYRLFRSLSPVAAGALAAFGLVNATAVLVSAAALTAALDVAAAPFGDAATTVQTMYLLSGGLWDVGGLFFGLWLLPMGWLALRSGWLPRALGWALLAGGTGYVLGSFAAALGAAGLAEALSVPSVVGELWMIGHLLVRGDRHAARPAVEPAAATA